MTGDTPLILLVDDDPIILKFIGANLKARSMNVQMAQDGMSALEIMKETMPDLVILDVMMPGMDGIEVCREIRKWSTVPVIMLTARVELKDKLTAFDEGADDYITKPFAINELMARIDAVLRRKDNSNSLMETHDFASN